MLLFKIYFHSVEWRINFRATKTRINPISIKLLENVLGSCICRRSCIQMETLLRMTFFSCLQVSINFQYHLCDLSRNSQNKTYTLLMHICISARMKVTAKRAPARRRVACVVWIRDTEIVVTTAKGKNDTNHPRPYGVFPTPWKSRQAAGTWRFRKRSVFPRNTCVGRKRRLIPFPHPFLPPPSLSFSARRFPTTRRRLIRGINSARVTKNRGGETAPRFTMSGVSLGFPRAAASFSLLPIFRLCYVKSLRIRPIQRAPHPKPPERRSRFPFYMQYLYEGFFFFCDRQNG